MSRPVEELFHNRRPFDIHSLGEDGRLRPRLFELHTKAGEVFLGLLAAAAESWNEPFALDIKGIPADKREVSRRKVLVHTLFHSQRHWAQLATLVRMAGHPSGFRGDLLLSSALK